MEAIENVATTFDVSSVGILGGEPFIRNDLDKIVDLFGNRSITIYTNGIILHKHPERLITGDNIHYAVSLDGMEEFHDYYRGKGMWKKPLKSSNILQRKKTRVI